MITALTGFVVLATFFAAIGVIQKAFANGSLHPSTAINLSLIAFGAVFYAIGRL